MNRSRTRICLGVVIDKNEIFRVAVVKAHELTSPWPLELRSFPDLESFEGYWLDHLQKEYKLERVSAVNCGFNGLNLSDWMATRNQVIEDLYLPTYSYQVEIDKFKIPETLIAAYQQALGCVYRECAVEVTDLILEEAHRLEKTLLNLAEYLWQLRAVLPRNDQPL